MRVNELGTEAPHSVTEAVAAAERQKERLAETLAPEQTSLFRKLENALSLQTGEETRYYYRAGFHDAVRFLLEWSDVA